MTPRITSSLLPVGAALLLAMIGHALHAQTTVLSSPVGVIAEKPSHGPSGYAFPLVGADLAVGIVSSNTGAVLAFGPAAGDVGAGLSPDGRYYIEVLTGPMEGERLDVDATATISSGGGAVVVEFGEGSYSTLDSLPADVLAGARCVIRPHLTLADLPAMFSPVLSGDRHRHRSDAVWILGTRGFDRFHLGEDDQSWYDEGGWLGGDWGRLHRAWCRRHGHPEPTDFRGMVIPPDVSVIIDINSGPKAWTHEGIVRTNAFRKNLVRGMQAFASGFPVDLSPFQIGAYVDPSTPSGNRWSGNNLFLRADQIEILCSQRRPLSLYFLRGDGHTWQSLLRSWNVNHANEPILGDTDMILILRKNPDPAFVIVRPFDL